MFKRMSFAVGALALVLCVGTGSSVYAQDQQNAQPNNPPASSGATTQDQQNGAMNGTDTGRRSRRRDRMRGNMSSSDMSTSTTARESHIRWSDAYRLTPIEHKRLRAMGLRDDEVFAVANASHASGVDVDEITQMVLRGRDYFQIAEQLGISYDSLAYRRPEWQTAEWQQGVREGWFTHRQGASSSSTTTGGGSSR